jgi:hypothetical protein
MSRFKTINEREGSWNTNSIQGYLSHRNSCIGHLQQAIEWMHGHLDFRAFEAIDKAVVEMSSLKKYDAYSNETSMLLLECANTIEAMQKGVGVTSSRDLVADSREAAMGRMEENA